MTPKNVHRRLPLRGRSGGFTLLELQVAIILLAFGVVTLASLMTTQSRLLARLRGNFKSSSTVLVTRSNDPWVVKLQTPARITTDPLTQPAAPTVTAQNTVSIVSQQDNLNTEAITVTVDLTP